MIGGVWRRVKAITQLTGDSANTTGHKTTDTTYVTRILDIVPVFSERSFLKRALATVLVYNTRGECTEDSYAKNLIANCIENDPGGSAKAILTRFRKYFGHRKSISRPEGKNATFRVYPGERTGNYFCTTNTWLGRHQRASKIRRARNQEYLETIK